MTKTKLLGGVMMAAGMLLTACGTTTAAAVPAPSTPAETVYAKSNAPIATEKAFQPTVVTTKEARKPNKPKYPCKNFLVRDLIDGGFKGENLREAWAIAMRESGGRADAISSTGDYGVFQFNRAAHGGSSWWNTAKLLTRDYNIKIAYKMSLGGKSWRPWDITGDGQHIGAYTPYSVYAKYKSFYNKYPDNCKK